MQNRARPLQCRLVPCCSLLSGDGQSPGWTPGRMWQVTAPSHPHDAKEKKKKTHTYEHWPCSRFPPDISFIQVCVSHCSPAMLEESQDGMDNGALSPAAARQVTIQRHPAQGFGFIAGSQRPVIVRSVSAGERPPTLLGRRLGSDPHRRVTSQALFLPHPQTAPPLASFSPETRSWPLTRRR